jgi:uncharacterized Zn finger protein
LLLCNLDFIIEFKKIKIPLSQFEQIIDETILKRGLDYFKKGFIKEFTEISHGEYEVSFEGTEMYLVQLEIKNNVIVEHTCGCPYDMEFICKHIVAAIFMINKTFWT